MWLALKNLFRYLRLKALVSFARFQVWRGGMPKASPDSILQIPSRTGRSIKAHYYKSTSFTPGIPSPLLINFHGSGFVFPLHGSDDFFCRKVTTSTPYSVLDIQYSLAPEYPWPACHNDAEDVVNWALKQPDVYSTSQIAISGFSAGANMACVAAASTFPKDTFNTLLAFYPPTDLSMDPEEKVAPEDDGRGGGITAQMARLFDASYLRFDPDKADPRVSPALGPVENYPENSLFITCGRDSLCLETERLAKRVEEKHGEGVVLRRMDKCGHAWDKRAAPGSYQESKRDETYGLAIDMLMKTKQ
ncbi:putative esterase/lipase [Aureobasidium pullulans]|uniref:Putative esterase/lipase n=1 Tax=Aureobasidium pullulans TaxID=5580 RepID=A0A4S9F9F3_AURPU|nr:putative esterase/lipase [Aureobasidium pullulans]